MCLYMCPFSKNSQPSENRLVFLCPHTGPKLGFRTFCIDKKYQKATRGGQLWRLRPGRCPLAAPPLTNFYASKTAGLACTLLWLIWRQYIRRRLSMGGHGGPRPKRSGPQRAPRADFWFFCSVTKEHQRPPAAPYRGAYLKTFGTFCRHKKYENPTSPP